MQREVGRILLYAVIVLGGGALLSALGFAPWFALGIPVVLAFGVSELGRRRVKVSTWADRHPRAASPDAQPEALPSQA
jgi:hypothetical protein